MNNKNTARRFCFRFLHIPVFVALWKSDAVIFAIARGKWDEEEGHAGSLERS